MPAKSVKPSALLGIEAAYGLAKAGASSIGRSDARSRPATESHGGNAPGPEIHTTAGTRSWGPRTNPSTRCRPRDFEETSSILGMADAFLAPCTWQRWFARHRCRA